MFFRKFVRKNEKAFVDVIEKNVSTVLNAKVTVDGVKKSSNILSITDSVKFFVKVDKNIDFEDVRKDIKKSIKKPIKRMINDNCYDSFCESDFSVVENLEDKNAFCVNVSAYYHTNLGVV